MNKYLNFHIIGYFGHKNIGDEQYKLSFESLFHKLFIDSEIKYNLKFHDCDKITSVEFNEEDVIILGGGDILNDYFLDKVISKFQGTTNKIIAISVGLPFKSVLTDTTKLNIIDYIFLRTKQDIALFEKYFHPHRIFYLPDISIELILNIPKSICENNQNNNKEIIDNFDDFNNIYTKLKKLKASNKKIVCISLNRHIHKAKNYDSILNNIVQFVKFLTNFDYHVVFIPFNTNFQNSNENDILIHLDVIQKFKKLTWTYEIYKTHLTNINFDITVDQTLLLFNLIDICVPMRFHACLFSIYKNIPFFPIFTTRKIRNLLVDIDWLYGYELDTDSKDLPKSLNINILISRFMTMLNGICSNSNIFNKLDNINLNIFGKHYCNAYPKIKEILSTNLKNNLNNKNSKVDDKINEIYNSVQEFAKIHNFDDFRKVNNSKLQDIIVSIVSYNLTRGSIYSKYNYGLKEKMFNLNEEYNYKEEWKWIFNNNENSHKINNLLSNSCGIFDIGFVDQEDYSGCHRSGWQYVYENIKYLHNDKSNLLFDLYLDRTFHWNKEINKALKLIPYKKNWIGVIHHTFDTSFSDFNCHNLLNNDEFKESLKYCKGLIVLSKFLALKIKKELNKIGYENIKIVSMTHPTDHNVMKFSINTFLENKDKKLVHVGGWLRNIYSFYNLSLPQTSYRHGILNISQHDFKLRKVALKGKNMNNYYPFDDFIDSFFNSLIKTGEVIDNEIGNVSNVGNACLNLPMISANVCCNISTNFRENTSKKITNNWYKHFYEDTISKLKTIDIINYTNNEEYDKLLSENIVFINLVDASAVNTIIECIVRNTPIIVNKHPAVVELLGEDYPLYYKNDTSDYYNINKEIENLVSNGLKIKKAYSYLSKMNKKKLMIENFVFSLINVVQELTQN